MYIKKFITDTNTGSLHVKKNIDTCNDTKKEDHKDLNDKEC